MRKRTSVAFVVSMGLATVPVSATAGTAPPTSAVHAASSAQVRQLVASAMTQIGQTTVYDPSYVRLAYPGGDVPIDRGVCTDVLIRAFRSIGVDLQVVVHKDMLAHRGSYPGGVRIDANIDHRRVRNLAVYFRRQGTAVPITIRAGDYRPGDIVTWDLDGLDHTGLVADGTVAGTDRHLIVHNIGAGTQLEDILFAFPITGHYRYPR